MRDKPLCFGCEEAIEEDPVYEAPCGHDDCVSACWHPPCLMKHREVLLIIKETNEFVDRANRRIAEVLQA